MPRRTMRSSSQGQDLTQSLVQPFADFRSAAVAASMLAHLPNVPGVFAVNLGGYMDLDDIVFTFDVFTENCLVALSCEAL